MKGLKVIGKIFAIIFCIVYFFALTGIMVILFTRNLFSRNYYADVLKSTDLSSIKISDIGNAEMFSGSGLDEDASLEEVFVHFFTEGGVDETKAKEIINDKEIRNIIGNYIGDYINYNLGGDKPQISKEDLTTVLNNKDLIDITGKIADEEIDKIYEQLNDLTEELIEGGPKNGNSGTNGESVIIHP